MKPEGQEYHEKREEAWLRKDKALYWLRDIYSQSQKIPSQIVLETEWIQRWVCLAGKLPH